MYCLGKKPARPNAVALKLSAYLDESAIPVPPMRIGRPWLVQTWGMFGNDRVGNCVWAGGAHETMMLQADAATPASVFTTATVNSDYSACTGFIVGQPSTDSGTDVADAAAYRQKTGIVDLSGIRHKIDIYAGLEVANLNQIALATQYLGVCGIGLQLPDNAEAQFNFNEPWSVEKGAKSVGGHYVPCLGRNSAGNFLVVSWGKLQAATPEWVETYMDEGLLYLSRERLRATGVTPQGLDLAKLTDDYNQITKAA